MSTPEASKSSTKDDRDHEKPNEEEPVNLKNAQEGDAIATSEMIKVKPTIGVEDEENEEKNEDKQDTADGAQPETQHDWQAIYSPQYNAYYFYNSKTQETTWTNPLVPEASVSTATVAPVNESQAMTTSAANPMLDGIDPDLAYLDPTLAAGGPSSTAGAYAARFNARTGRFTAMDGRDPSHLSEYERMKRMSDVFFDMTSWEQDVAARKAQEAADEAEGRRRKKKPTKADLVSPHFSRDLEGSYRKAASFFLCMLLVMVSA